MFFLTAVDTERLDIKGSRDPLGFVPIWGDFGRKVVGNLSTASNSVRGFTTLLLGLYFAERVSSDQSDRETARLSAFLQFEQLAGFVRYIRNRDARTRGITQIKKRVNDTGGRSLTIGAAQAHQILSNQKTYGLWGLYITPAIDSGLVVPRELRLTPEAHAFVESAYISRLRQGKRDESATIERLLSTPNSQLAPNGRHAEMFEALASILPPTFSTSERQFYRTHLVLGGTKPKESAQPRLATLIEVNLDGNSAFDLASLDRLIEAAKRAADTHLRDALVRIRDLEGLLVAAANLFGFLQHRDRVRLAEVVLTLRQEWGNGLQHIRSNAISHMRADLSRVLGDGPAGDRLVALAESMQKGAWDTAIDLVLGHNQFVMASRNGSQPWIQRTGDKLDVRYRDDSHPILLSPKELARAWRSTFYIDPLKSVSDELRGAA